MKKIWEERIVIANYERAWYSKGYKRVERDYRTALVSAFAYWDRGTGSLRLNLAVVWQQSHIAELNQFEAKCSFVALNSNNNSREAVARMVIAEIDAYVAAAKAHWELHKSQIDMSEITDEQIIEAEIGPTAEDAEVPF